jgi:hypothetical protein
MVQTKSARSSPLSSIPAAARRPRYASGNADEKSLTFIHLTMNIPNLFVDEARVIGYMKIVNGVLREFNFPKGG